MADLHRLPGCARCIVGVALAVALSAWVGGVGAEGAYPLSSAVPSSDGERHQWLPGADCGEHNRAFHRAADPTEAQQVMERELLAYQGLVEEALGMRAQAIRLVHALREKADRGEALSGQDLQLLNQGAVERQVGEAYDFNFDVESTHRIVCSELVYHAYGHLDWPTVRRLGRVTTSPDNIAVRAAGDGPLGVALLYHDGSEVAAMREAAMAELVERPVVELAGR